MASRVIDVTMQLIDKVTQPLQGITANLKDSGRQWQNAGKDIMRTGDNITKTGQGLTKGLTVPIVGAATAAIKTAADFEAGMSKVQAISGASSDSMKLLEDKAQEMGAKTKFSATEAADAFSYMAMAGWKTEQMMSGIEGVMYLAGATGEDLAQTSDIVTDAMTAFGMAADGTSMVVKDGIAKEVPNTTRFVDVMAAAANNANTNVAMLGESFKYVAGTAGGMGYEVEDVATALGLMANSGIKASQGGTALNNLMTRMAKPTKESANAMNMLGLSLQNEDGTMKSFMQIMEDIRDGFPELKMSASDFQAQMNSLDEAFEAGELTEKEYGKEQEKLMHMAYGAEGALTAEYAAMLAGKTGMSGLMAIVNASDEDFDKLSTAITNSNGACEEMYKITQDNLIGRLTILKSTVESVAIGFGNELIPWVEKGTKWIQNLADKFNSLDSSQRQQIIKWALMAAAIGPALIAVGKMTTGIGKFVFTIGKIGSAIAKAGGVMAALTGPGAIVVAVLVAIGVVIALIVTHWDQFKTACQTAMNALKMHLANAGITMDYFKDKFNPIIEKIQEIWKKVQQAWQIIQPYVNIAMNFIVNVFFLRIKLAIDTFLTTVKFVLDIIFSYIDHLLEVLNGVIDFITGVFTGNWELAWQGVSEIFNGVVSFWEEVFQGFYDWIMGLLGGIAEFIGGLFSSIGSLGEQASEAASTVNASGHGGGGGTIPGNALGTSFWRGGLTQIHERGGEIIDLPKGTRIYPHDESVKMAYAQGQKQAAGGQNGGGSRNVVVNIPKLADSISVRSDSDIDAIATKLADILERTEQNLGGGDIGYVY